MEDDVVDPLPSDHRETRNLPLQLSHSQPGVVEKPGLDCRNRPSGQLLPLASIRSSLPGGQIDRHQVPVTRGLGTSHLVPLSPLRNTSEAADLSWSVFPSFPQQKHSFSNSGRCVSFRLACHVDNDRMIQNLGFI